MDEIERARMAMGGAKSGALPVEAMEPAKQNDGLTDEERAELAQARHPKQPIASVGNFNADGDAIEMSVDDFLAATKREHYVSKLWKSKNRILKVKKFTKGDNDRVSSPLMKKSVSVEISDEDEATKAKPRLDISMETFIEMEKIMVELGLSYYQKDNKPLIDRAYIDKVLTGEEFKELADLIREVNPEAISATAKVEKNDQIKK
jgi:hypothetical protein